MATILEKGGIFVKVAFVTSVASSVVLAIVLKGLSYFHLVNWKPITFLKESELVGHSSAFSHWGIFVIMLFLFSFILFIICQFLYFMPAGFTSLIFGLIIAVLVEWKIYDLAPELSSFKKLSIPFIVVIIGFARFIIETAGYHMRAKSLVNRNKLPYKSGVIK